MTASGRLDGLLRHLGRAGRSRDGGAFADADLLDRWILGRDESAFEALVWRHGPMVLGVCRRVLGNASDAEDAFQATFLVLVRKAPSIVPRSRVGNWLHGVAHRTALKALQMNSRRRKREQVAGQRTAPTPSGDENRQLARLDEELQRLPERYRVPIVLCHLEGRTVQEVARELGLPQGTVASRLSRGRSLLARRMNRPDAATLDQRLPSVALPASLVSSTVQAATVAVAGGGGLVGVVSAKAVLLSERVVKAMLLARLTPGAVLLLLTATLAAAAAALFPLPPGYGNANEAGLVAGGRAAGEGRAARPANIRKVLEALTWTLTGADEARGEIHVSDQVTAGRAREKLIALVGSPGGKAPTGLHVKGLKVRPGAPITLDGKPAKLGDLKPGTSVTLRMEAARPVVAAVEARSPVFRYRLKAIDHEAGTITVTLAERNLDMESLPVAAGATIRLVVPGDLAVMGNGRLEDLRAGMHLALELAVDDERGVVVRSVVAAK